MTWFDKKIHCHNFVLISFVFIYLHELSMDYFLADEDLRGKRSPLTSRDINRFNKVNSGMFCDDYDSYFSQKIRLFCWREDKKLNFYGRSELILWEHIFVFNRVLWVQQDRLLTVQETEDRVISLPRSEDETAEKVCCLFMLLLYCISWENKFPIISYIECLLKIWLLQTLLR